MALWAFVNKLARDENRPRDVSSLLVLGTRYLLYRLFAMTLVKSVAEISATPQSC